MAAIARTLPIPLIHRVPRPLAAVLHVSDLGQSCAGHAEHLRVLLVSLIMRARWFCVFVGLEGGLFGDLRPAEDMSVSDL